MRACCNSCGGKLVVVRGAERLSKQVSRHYGVCSSCGEKKRIFVEVEDVKMLDSKLDDQSRDYQAVSEQAVL